VFRQHVQSGLQWGALVVRGFVGPQMRR
jgi:hypothetical protein